MSMAEELTVTECVVSSAWALHIPEHTGWPTFEPWKDEALWRGLVYALLMMQADHAFLVAGTKPSNH